MGVRFDEAVKEVLTTRPGDAVGLLDHPDTPLAVPTPDHFLPVLYLAGMADATGETCDVTIEGYSYGSLSMTSYSLGLECPPAVDPSPHSAAALPNPDIVAPEDTNA